MLDRFTLITAVWGRNHPQLLLNLCLPSLLAPDNLPKLASLSKVSYIIYTTKRVAQELAEAQILQQLKEFVDLEIVEFEHNFANNHVAMNWCHKSGLQYAVKHNSYAVFIPPDCIWSQQSMLCMYNIVKRGYKIVHMTGFRLVKELFYPEIMQKHANGVLDISSRDLVKIALNYLHSITISHFFNERDGYLMPANLIWDVRGEGILARNFHFHPLVIDAVGKKCDFHSTIDDDLSLEFNASDSDEYIIADSDEMIAFEVSSWEHKVLASYNKGNVQHIVEWAKDYTNAKHREYIKQPLKIHSGEMTNSLWEAKIAESDKVVEQILLGLKPGYYKEQLIDKLKKSLHPQTIYITLYRNSVTRYLFRSISFILREIVCFLYRFLQSNKVPYPWHWSYVLYRDINQPMIDLLKSMRGTLLYIDNSYAPLNIRKMVDSKVLHVASINPFAIANDIDNRVQFREYDYIIVRDPNSLVYNMEFWNLLPSLLKSSGILICNFINSEEIKKVRALLPADVKCVNDKQLGGAGTMLTRNVHYSVNKIFNKQSVLGSSLITNGVRLISMPFLLFISPIFSLIVLVMNKFSSNKDLWVERSITFTRTQA